MKFDTGIFIDYSGSTMGSDEYHAYVAALLEEQQRKCDSSKVKVYRWETRCSDVSLEVALANARGLRHGSGGTQPQCIIEHVLKRGDTYDAMILITDGDISRYDVDETARRMDAAFPTAKPWGRVDAHIVPMSGRSLDASVIAPFISDVPYTVRDRAEGFISACTIDMQRCRELIGSISDAEALERSYAEIEARLASSGLTKSADYGTRQALLHMRKRVVDSMSRKHAPPGGGDESAVAPTIANVERLAAEHYYYHSSDSSDSSCGFLLQPQRKIDHLISLCDKAGDFALDRLAGLRAQRLSRPVDDSTPPEDVPDVYDCVWEDDILMDDTACMLLTFKGDAAGVLSGLDKDALESIERNPLLLLRNRVLVEKLQGAALPMLSREVLARLLSSSSSNSLSLSLTPSLKSFS